MVTKQGLTLVMFLISGDDQNCDYFHHTAIIVSHSQLHIVRSRHGENVPSRVSRGEWESPARTSSRADVMRQNRCTGCDLGASKEPIFGTGLRSAWPTPPRSVLETHLRTLPHS